MLDTGCRMLDEEREEEMSYKNLEIWHISKDLVITAHRMTLNDLPKFEMYEEGSQIRRSCKSIKSNIAEGCGRRRYKQEFVRYLTYAQASCDETIDHLETLFETGSLSNQGLYEDFHLRLQLLGKN
jgi:four helix bundle protein